MDCFQRLLKDLNEFLARFNGFEVPKVLDEVFKNLRG